MFISNAYAQTAGGAEGGLLSFLPIVLMFIVLYFLMIRPQMKRQKEHKSMMEALNKGDEVVTAGGMLGRITKVTDAHVILEVANECDALGVSALAAALDDGRARRRLFDDWSVAAGDEVRGSAHLFAPDGTGAQNPGITIGWREDDGPAGGTAHIERDDPTAIDELVRRAAA